MVLQFGTGQLFVDNGIFSEPKEDDQVNVWDGNRWIASDTVVKALTEHFQANAATGTFINNPQNINNGSVTETSTTCAYANTINQYAEVEFPISVRIRKFRQYGINNQSTDGRWTIQYFDDDTYSYVDWITDVPTQVDGWSDYTTVKTVTTTKIKIICTTVADLNNKSYIRELEVIY